MDVVSIYSRHCSFYGVRKDQRRKVRQQISQETRLIASQIYTVKSCVVWPIVLLDQVKQTDTSATACHNTGSFCFGNGVLARHPGGRDDWNQAISSKSDGKTGAGRNLK